MTKMHVSEVFDATTSSYYIPNRDLVARDPWTFTLCDDDGFKVPFTLLNETALHPTLEKKVGFESRDGALIARELIAKRLGLFGWKLQFVVTRSAAWHFCGLYGTSERAYRAIKDLNEENIQYRAMIPRYSVSHAGQLTAQGFESYESIGKRGRSLRRVLRITPYITE